MLRDPDENILCEPNISQEDSKIKDLDVIIQKLIDPKKNTF